MLSLRSRFRFRLICVTMRHWTSSSRWRKWPWSTERHTRPLLWVTVVHAYNESREETMASKLEVSVFIFDLFTWWRSRLHTTVQYEYHSVIHVNRMNIDHHSWPIGIRCYIVWTGKRTSLNITIFRSFFSILLRFTLRFKNRPNWLLFSASFLHLFCSSSSSWSP